MKRTALIAALAVSCLIVGGIAYASIPDGNGVIHGCRKNSGGALRVIDTDAGQTCMSSETALSWSQTGPQGPAGPSSLATTLVESTTPIGPGTFSQASVSCPAGQVVTGGGIDIAGSDPGGANSALVERYSGPGDQGTSWTLGMTNTGTEQLSFTVQAICVVGTTSGA